MSSPLISVIVPVYNVEQYLEKCIDSILTQTYPNIEIILIDDGSTDTSGNICERYASTYHNVRTIHKENGGLSSARNAGMEVAKGDYIGFVDSDDMIEPNMYEVLFAGFSADNIGIVSSDIRIIDETGEKTLNVIKNKEENKNSLIGAGEYLDFFAKKTTIFPYDNVWCKLYRKQLIQTVRYVEGRNCEDVYFMYHLVAPVIKGNWTLKFIPDQLYCYRVRKGSISQDKSKPMYVDLIKNLNEIIRDCDRQYGIIPEPLIRKYTYQLIHAVRHLSEHKGLKQIYYPEIIQILRKTPIRYFTYNSSGIQKIKIHISSLVLKAFPTLYLKIS